MKSSALNLGNVNLKGKKHRLLQCGCCTAIDLRGKYKEKLDNKLMKEFRYESSKISYS